MKKRIFAIMDRNKKKAGYAILCCTLMLTLGTGFAFAANAANPEARILHETAAFVYRFQPNPEIYSQYSPYGIAISDDGEMLLYNGQRVRLFVDESSDTEAFFLDAAGELNLSVIRDAAGNLLSIESIPEHKAQEYRSAFFADDTLSDAKAKETVQENIQVTVQDLTGRNKFEQYSAYGITLSADGEIMHHNGQRVKLFVDKLSDGNFETLWADQAGTANLSVVRNKSGQITAVESITEEQAQKMLFSR